MATTIGYHLAPRSTAEHRSVCTAGESGIGARISATVSQPQAVGLTSVDVSSSSTERPLTRTDVMTSSEVAGLLAMPKSTVDDWARRGLIPSRKRGKRRFFLRWEVERWLVQSDDVAR